MSKNSPKKQKTNVQSKRVAKRALIVFVLATAFFLFSVINYFRVEG